MSSFYVQEIIYKGPSKQEFWTVCWKKGKHQTEKTNSSETSLLCWSHIVGWGSSSLVQSKMNEVTPYKFSIWVTRVTTALLEH